MKMILANSNFNLNSKIPGDKFVKELSDSVSNLGENITNAVDSTKSIIDFFNKVGNFFKEALILISSPGKLLNSLQPWIIIAMMCMLILRVIGFNCDKWFRLCFIVLIISLFF